MHGPCKGLQIVTSQVRHVIVRLVRADNNCDQEIQEIGSSVKN
jgi:hypothetical protein